MLPSSLLYSVYAAGSLRNTADGVRFEILNRLMNIEQVALRRLGIDGTPAPMDQLRLGLSDAGGEVWVDGGQPFPLPLGARAIIHLSGRKLPQGAHKIEICIEAPPFGEMQFTVEDSICKDVQDGVEAKTGAPIAGATPGGDADEPHGSGETGSAGSAGSRDPVNALYDSGLRLLSSAMDTYLGAQKTLLTAAIQQAESERIVGSRGAELAQSVVAELTTSFEELAAKGVQNFAAAGRLFLAAAIRPPQGGATKPDGVKGN